MQMLGLNRLKHVIAEFRTSRVVDSGLQIIQDDRQRFGEGLFHRSDGAYAYQLWRGLTLENIRPTRAREAVLRVHWG